MTAPFMRAYTELLVKTCHRRGAVAMGGMAAFVPNRADPEATAVAFGKVRADKTREANDGFDGSWVAHPDLVPVCREVFDAVLGDRPNQLDRQRPEVEVTAAQLLDIAAAAATVTEAGPAHQRLGGVAYTVAWLPAAARSRSHSLMEDAATAEISRSQVWQRVQHGSARRHRPHDDRASSCRRSSTKRSRPARRDPARVVRRVHRAGRAAGRRICLADEYVDFLTLPAYELLE